ncbi:uncharacterized protein BT62DRAFT_934117 [Guyanagaster necrorhizus]|uniref:Uncharacterized protein n=1 Tax=Guyanagaster necrorhizus TaxID=856835 RepID=A0A9P7VPY9_9AGAR|nr:uncharacterized protein BT62DRAFT_934117 [Guyanagaster necrorhizus MCA 3950]KAG7444462.1 hypothetical protein BT62DRAFT_934117 [Guyanagaster necrorhizus MCA 3950]
MLFMLSVLAFFALVALLIFRYRVSLAPYVPERVKAFFPKLRHYTPLSTFAEQANAGLSSSDFDIEANLRNGDSRTGLDEQGTQEVMEIMQRERVNFDQARLIRHNRILAHNGIDASGMPLDSKAVTHL